jgi:hypothetical protein
VKTIFHNALDKLTEMSLTSLSYYIISIDSFLVGHLIFVEKLNSTIEILVSEPSYGVEVGKMLGIP